MTLTRFFTKYVYIPLGGSRRGKARTYLNIFLVFLLSGFWHGASWSFVLWGVMHGVFSVLTRLCKKFVEKVPRVINWVVTFVFVNIAWVFFRAGTIPKAVARLQRVFAGGFRIQSQVFLDQISSPEISEVLSFFAIEERFPAFVLVGYFVVALGLILGSKNAYEKMKLFQPNVLTFGITLILLMWSVFSFAGISTFLYFNF